MMREKKEIRATCVFCRPRERKKKAEKLDRPCFSSFFVLLELFFFLSLSSFLWLLLFFFIL